MTKTRGLSLTAGIALATAFTFSLAYGQGKPADTSLGSGKYTIRNANGSYLYNSYNSNSLGTTSEDRYAAGWLDIWYLRKAVVVGDGDASLKNAYNIFVEKENSFVLDLVSNKDKEGQNVQAYKSFNGKTPAQRWFLDRNDDGSFFIRTTNASGRVITEENQRVTIKENKNLNTQKWFIEKDTEERRAKINKAKEAAEQAAKQAAKQAAANRVAEAKKAKASIKTFTDSRDKKSYKKVTIGTQTWMVKNLDYKGKDGKLGKCYGNKAANCTKYGRLYDWETAKTACPAGWHLPSDAEWKILVDLVGDDEAQKELKAKSGWNFAETCYAPGSCSKENGNGKDNFGFSALPGGSGDSDGNFGGVGNRGSWWSATDEGDAEYAFAGVIVSDSNSLVQSDSIEKSSLLSVRCVQD